LVGGDFGASKRNALVEQHDAGLPEAMRLTSCATLPSA
jgi:hypothetical protein